MWKSNTKSLQCFLIKTGSAWRWITERLNALLTDDGELSQKCGVHCNSRRLKIHCLLEFRDLVCFKFILSAIEDYNIVEGKKPFNGFPPQYSDQFISYASFYKRRVHFSHRKGLKNALTFNKPTEVCNIVPQKIYLIKTPVQKVES